VSAPGAHGAPAGRSGVDRRALGARAENVAADFLAAQGADILLRNYRRRLGELDLVALHRGALLIVEVRTRSSAAYGGAAASVDGLKRRRIVRAAQQLLQQRKDLARLPVRFDVTVVSELSGAKPRVEWIRGAFEA
jgi:putative endonuclease